jgi:AP-4 complex subunit beta-1
MAEPTFFSEMKKGEVNELRVQLRGATSEKDPLKVRAIVQKVISYMTLGIDMSPLFTDMVMVCSLWRDFQYKLISNHTYIGDKHERFNSEKTGLFIFMHLCVIKC